MTSEWLYKQHKTQRLTGVLLILATVLALYLENSTWSKAYHYILHSDFNITSHLHINVHEIVNEALMACFFLYVGIEVKNEMVTGELQNWQDRLLPLGCALGGIIAPGLIYFYINHHVASNVPGWAIPTATDIAFAIGLIVSVSANIPKKLKVLLVSIAIFDDLFAILVIALLYTKSLNGMYLIFALLNLLVIFFMSKARVIKLIYYIIPGILVWYCVLLSGIHTTVSGFLVAVGLPLVAYPGQDTVYKSNLDKLYRQMKPWVEYGILPVFALANAGVHLADFSFTDLYNPVAAGVFYGLYIGKPLGIGLVLMVFYLVQPQTLGKLSRYELLGMSFFCGIGFTMSLFIGDLAFGDFTDKLNLVKIGVLTASLAASITGAGILAYYYRNQDNGE